MDAFSSKAVDDQFIITMGTSQPYFNPTPNQRTSDRVARTLCFKLTWKRIERYFLSYFIEPTDALIPLENVIHFSTTVTGN